MKWENNNWRKLAENKTGIVVSLSITTVTVMSHKCWFLVSVDHIIIHDLFTPIGKSYRY